MSYVRKHLLEGESIAYETRLHWSVLIGPVVTALLFALTGGLLFVLAARDGGQQTPVHQAKLVAGAVLMLIAIVFIVRGVLQRNSTEMTVTNRRVFIKTGLAARRTIELLLSRIESIGVEESAMGRMIGFRLGDHPRNRRHSGSISQRCPTAGIPNASAAADRKDIGKVSSLKRVASYQTERLARTNGCRRRGPIRGDEIHTPEMRRGREKFDADALAFVGGFAEKHDARFLLFLREGIGEDEDGVHGQRLVQVHQAAVGVDHDRFAGLAEPAAVGILSGHHHAHPHENPGTASNLATSVLGHDTSMLRHFARCRQRKCRACSRLQREPVRCQRLVRAPDLALVFPLSKIMITRYDFAGRIAICNSQGSGS